MTSEKGESGGAMSAPIESDYPNLVEQLVRDLNGAHDEIVRLHGCKDPQNYDWPEWTPQANSIRWAERLLGKKLAKTDIWTLFPTGRSDERR